MTTLVYKQKHEGDPSRSTGVFGCDGCMKRARRWRFDAVIGVGGIGAEADSNDLKGKLTWIGLGAHKSATDKLPLVTFEHFLYLGKTGPTLRTIAPSVAKRMYDRNIRATTDVGFASAEREEIAKILSMATQAGPSPQRNDTRKNDTVEDELRTTRRCSVRRCRAARER